MSEETLWASIFNEANKNTTFFFCFKKKSIYFKQLHFNEEPIPDFTSRQIADFMLV